MCFAAVYVQVLLILQYSYLTAARCLCIPGNSADISGGGGSSGCVWALNTDPTATRHVFDLLGLHSTSAGVLPLFLIYLALLMYNYQLGSSSSYQPGMPGPANAAAAPPADPAGPMLARPAGQGAAQGVSAAAVGSVSRQGPASGAGAVALIEALQGWVSKLWVLRKFVVHKLSYYIR